MKITKLTQKELDSLLQNNPGIHLVCNGKTLIGESLKPKRQSKLRNVKVYVYTDGTTSYGEKIESKGAPQKVYDSIKEYNRSIELGLMVRGGVISDLKEQVKFVIQPSFTTNTGKVKELYYRADFSYIKDGIRVVEDVKPFDKRTGKYRFTRDFANKWKLLQYMHPEYAFQIY